LFPLKEGKYGYDDGHTNTTEDPLLVLPEPFKHKRCYSSAALILPHSRRTPKLAPVEKYQELKKYKLESGDVLITIMGTVGRTCVFPDWIGEAICTKHVYRIQTDRSRLDPEYLCTSIRFSPIVRAQLGASITGQIVDAITSGDLKGLLVEVPPIDLQKRFTRLKQSLDNKTVQWRDSKSKLDRLFDILLRRAFLGDLTAKWREAHMKELLAEMEEQAKYLAAADSNNHRKAVELQGSLFKSPSRA
jgi:hypothetical protein